VTGGEPSLPGTERAGRGSAFFCESAGVSVSTLHLIRSLEVISSARSLPSSAKMPRFEGGFLVGCRKVAALDL
jgi:hypothetical protein